MKAGKNGITSKTAKNILFGAGTIHKGLKHTDGAWNFKESCVGATSGGSKLSIVPEVTPVEVDGAQVAIKGLEVKTGETATLEVNFIELSAEIMQNATIGQVDDTEAIDGYTVIKSKSDIQTGDYWENIAFVGKTLEGKNIIVILENALCTSGLELEGKNKEAGIPAFTFACHADPDFDEENDLDTLPWKIYYPTAV